MAAVFFFFRDHNMAAFPSLRRQTEILPNGAPLSPFCANPNSAACDSVSGPYFVRRQYGGSLVGPINKEKLFFFMNDERADQIGANVLTNTDPTPVPTRALSTAEVLGNHFIRFYGQDTWQIRPGFTLNYGLGWSFEATSFMTTWICP